MNRKEAIQEYKRTVQPMGVYQIANQLNGKIFIGSAKDVRSRINRIKFQLENNLYPQKQIQNDYSAAGGDGFGFEVLDQLKPKDEPGIDYSDELKILEEMWLERLQPYGDKGYNEKPKRE